MIEAKFAFFQVQQKGMLGHADKLVEATFDEAPERFNTIDMRRALPKFVVAVVDALMTVKAHIHQPVVAAPAIGIDHRGRVNFAADDALQRLFRATWHYFRVDLTATFEQAQNDGFTTRPEV